MTAKEKTVSLELTFDESGILCNTLMQAINMSGGLSKVPAYILNLYQKLADANDKARELERASDAKSRSKKVKGHTT